MQDDDLAKLKESIQPKNWSETISYDTWEIFKVISEMVEGFEKLSRIGPTFSGSSSAIPEKPTVKLSGDRQLKPSSDVLKTRLERSGAFQKPW